MEDQPRIRDRTIAGGILTAVPYCDQLTTSPATKLTLAPAPRRSPQPPIGAGDPMVDAAARLLSIPLRHMYAALWRVGMIEITS
jgi:hypothetical protein